MRKLLILSLILLSLSAATKTAFAAPVEISGWAWSDTIGWISFNCANTGSCATSNYKVTVGSGTLGGYAWSDNIGWIDFSGAKIINGSLSGWAKACAGSVDGKCGSSLRSDGWDGQISLSGPNYGVKVNAAPYSTYAWGSDVVGWVAFDVHMPASAAQPTPTVSPLSPVTDLCPNIVGIQGSIPAGMIKNASGECVTSNSVTPPVITPSATPPSTGGKGGGKTTCCSSTPPIITVPVVPVTPVTLNCTASNSLVHKGSPVTWSATPKTLPLYTWTDKNGNFIRTTEGSYWKETPTAIGTLNREVFFGGISATCPPVQVVDTQFQEF